MTFEEAIAALGEEFGVELSAEDGKVSFEVSADGGDFGPVNFTLTYQPETEMLLVSADAGVVDLEGGDAPLLKMLEANHMYSGTEGASFSLDGEHAKLERLICLDAFWQEGGKSILMSLFRSVQAWREENGTSAEIE